MESAWEPLWIGRSEKATGVSHAPHTGAGALGRLREWGRLQMGRTGPHLVVCSLWEEVRVWGRGRGPVRETRWWRGAHGSPCVRWQWPRGRS